MKKFVTFLIASAFSTLSIGQFHWATHSVSALDVLRTPSNQYVFLYYNGFTVFDSTGIPVFSEDFFDQVIDVYEMPDSSIVFSQMGYANSFFPFLTRYDKNWQPAPFQNPSHQLEFAKGVAFNDGSSLLFRSYNLAKRDSDGNFIWYETFQSEFTDVQITSGDTILGVDSNGLLVIGKDGNLLSSFPNYGCEHIEILANGSYVGSKNGTVFLLSPAFDLIETVLIPGESIASLNAADDKIVVLTNSHHVYLYDANLTPINDFQLSNIAAHKFISLASDGIIVAGEGQFGDFFPNAVLAAFIKKYSFDGTDLNPPKNIGVTDVQIDGDISISHPDYYKMVLKDVKVSVKNYGPSVVNNLRVNAKFPTIIVSSFPFDHVEISNFLSKEFQNLLLVPGETTELVWDEMVIWFEENPTGLFQLCLWTSLPDQQLDIEPGNDGHCAEPIVKVKELVSNIDIKTYPNPARERLTILSGFTASKHNEWSLFNQHGRLVLKEILQAGNGEWDISLTGVPSGLYFWELRSEAQRIGVGKLVVIK